MIFDVWTILNPILRTFIYFSVLTTIGTILFSLHFSNFFDNIVKVYCQNLIKKFSIFGLFIGLLVFLSVAGNLGGDFQSVIDISLIETDGELKLIIKDQGIGIKKEHLPRIFDKLYRVPTGNIHNVKGFGLGLNYAKGIINHYGWEITVNSEFGKGTVFTIIFKNIHDV